MRWVRGIAALVAMLVVIVGAPVVLVSWGGFGTNWWRAGDGSLLLSVLTIAGWVAWLVFTLTTAAELARQFSGNRFAVNLPLLGGLQALCAGLVLAVVALAASPAEPTATRTPTSPAQPTTAPASSRAPTPTAIAPTAGVERQATTVSRLTQAPAAVPVAPEADHGSYRVRAGDDLWSIAEHLLGDGRRWRELARSNPDALADPTRQLPEGTRLSVPARPEAERIRVVRGDTLSELAQDHLGKASLWPRIEAANDELIEDPDHIEVGWELVLPERPRNLADRASPTSPASPAPAPESAGPAAPAQPAGQDAASPDATYPDGEAAEPTVGAGEDASPRTGNAQPTLQAGQASSAPPVPSGAPTAQTDDGQVPGATAEPVPRDGPAPRTATADPTAEPGAAAGTPTAQPTADLTAQPGAGPAAGTPTVQPPAETADGPAQPSATAEPTAAAADGDPVPAQASDDRSLPDLAMLGTLSALAAAGLMGGWQARRLLQHRTRQPGRRVAQPIDQLARFQAALGRRQARDLAGTLDSALRAIGRHHHLGGTPLPLLAQVTLGPDRLHFQWAEQAGDPPAGFGGDRTAWILELGQSGEAGLDQPWHPCPYPALVSLGTMPGGDTVLVDLERVGVLGVSADSPELQLASLASMAMELGCAPWAAELSVVIAGGDPGLARATVADTVSWVPDAAAGLALLVRRHGARASALAGAELRRLRVDPDRAEAVAAEVFVFRDQLPAEDRAELDKLLSGSQLGISAVVPAESGADAEWELFGDPLRPNGRLPDGEALLAHAIPEATRTAVESLYRVAESVKTEPAPWWDEESGNAGDVPRDRDEDPVEIVNLRRLTRPHPTVMLIGPVALTGAAGAEPERARQQLIEMCTWLIEHPGRTATEMAAGLGIAETTRRSNMSRLRTWLGADPDGEQYLPDAYSGRIRLQAEVTSDIQRLRLLTGPGVNRISETGLVSALDLVRGDLFADAAPGQWFWAEELRSDASSTLRDAGLVLVDRALARGDIDLARWAAGRALVVAPDDELLLCARIRTEHAAGDRAAVERHVLRLSQQARALGVDLMPETVMLCQQVMEGRARARRA